MGKSMKQPKSFSLGLLAATIAMIAGVVTGATGCQQDPFANKSEQIRNGIPPELQKEPTAAKPRDKDALRIDSLDFYSFKEQIESEFTITGRVLEPKGTFELSVDNLKEFPGAKFDPKTGNFKWTPPRDTTGGEYGRERRLVVRLTSPSLTGGTTEGTTKAILIFVTRAELDPEIISVDDLVRVPTREGEIRKFNVTVRDPDATDVDGGRPRLNSIPSKRGPSDVSGLVYLQESVDPNPMQDPANKQQWIFKMVLDLRVPADQRGRDFTRTQENFKFGLQAISRFGRNAVRDVDASILTDVLKPEVSWFDPIEAVAGIENVIQFTVYDPYAEGKLSVNFVTRVDQLPGAATSSCKVVSREGNVLCKISWKPLATTTGDFAIEFEGLNQSRVFGDTKFTKETFKRMIRVVPGQPVIPPAPPSGPGKPPGPGPGTPTPTPTPGPGTPAPGPGTPTPLPGPHSTSLPTGKV